MHYDYLNKVVFSSINKALETLKSIRSDWVNSTGDCVRGDKVVFIKANFSGSFKNPKYENCQIIVGTIENDSYGVKKQQHTFSIKTVDNEPLRVKGRNLYRYITLRKLWIDEQERLIKLKDKHERGSAARRARTIRKQQSC